MKTRQAVRAMKARQKKRRQARAIVADEFVRLWAPAPYLPFRIEENDLTRAGRAAAAKTTAITWLGRALGLPQFAGIDELNDIAVLRRAYVAIRHVSIADIGRWRDEAEQGATSASDT